MTHFSRRALAKHVARLSASAAGMVVLESCGLLPLSATNKSARIGVLRSTPYVGTTAMRRWEQFVEGLRALGWAEGKNIVFDWAIANPPGQGEQLPQLATELI